MIYLDNASTTKLLPELIEELPNIYNKYFGNNSSLHTAGKDANMALEEARREIASIIGINSKFFYFTSGSTESINLLIFGYVEHLKLTRSAKNEIIISSFEHPAVFSAVKSLEDIGFVVHEVKPNTNGVISIEKLKSKLSEKTVMVSIMHVNNEIGVMQDINSLAQATKSFSDEILFFTDTTQSIGKIPYKFDFKLIDAIILSGHKFGGPKGIGGLYLNPTFRIHPRMKGGPQERGFRPGTVNVPGAILMAKAISLNNQNLHKNLKHVRDLKELLLAELNSLKVRHEIVIPEQLSSPYILSIIIYGVRSLNLIDKLSEAKICISSRSACSSNSHKKSRVLESISIPLEKIDNVVRISFSPQNNNLDIKSIASEINKSLQIKHSFGN